MFKVFLSSTARDLREYREAAARAIHAIEGFHCVRMEDFGARDAVADAFCREKVAGCDVVVLLLGLCYGSSPDDSEDSYTRQEYGAAVASGRPRLAFFSKEGDYYAGYYREADAQWERSRPFAWRSVLSGCGASSPRRTIWPPRSRARWPTGHASRARG
jgi:hypothetical protein